MATSDLVGPLFSVATDPIRLEQLLDSWVDRILSVDGHHHDLSTLDSSELRTHLNDAVRVLGLVEETHVRPQKLEEELANFPLASFAISSDGKITFANSAAKALGVVTGGSLESLNIDPNQIAGLRKAILGLLRASVPDIRVLRLNRRGDFRSIALRLSQSVRHPGTVVVTAAQLNWPESLPKLLLEAFDLTSAETEVLRALCAGSAVPEIAKSRGTSVATVRTQIHALLEKTDTKSQTELVIATIGLANMAALNFSGRSGIRDWSPSGLTVYRTLKLRDGRSFDWIERGLPGGKPFVWLPTDFGLTKWLSEAEAEMVAQGFRMIIPVRAGYGRSSPAPVNINVFELAASDTLTLLQELGIKKCPVVSIGDDLLIALHMAHSAPHKITGILGVSPGMPVVRPEHFALMPKWARFMRANARYAPFAYRFIVRSGFGFARRVGVKAFLQAVFGSSKPDLEALENPSVLAALVSGSEITLSDNFNSAEAFIAEGIAFQTDWTDKLKECPIGLTLLVGHHDPFTPFEIVRDYADRNSSIDFHQYPDDGYLLAYTRWREVLTLIEAVLP